MSKIILDFGSGNTHKNNWEYLKRMLDELRKAEISKGTSEKHEIIIKHQLFKKAGDNISLDYEIFKEAYHYAYLLGYKTTASVFDKESLNFLLQFDVPFIKIANRRALDWLIGEVPRKIPVYVSVGSMPEGETLLYGYPNYINQNRDIALFCVSQYPASTEEYERRYSKGSLKHGISDHTIGLDLYKKYQPRIWEKHYKLPDSTGLDAGPFAISPEELKEIL
jgi:sialic acid synthase SpsE